MTRDEPMAAAVGRKLFEFLQPGVVIMRINGGEALAGRPRALLCCAEQQARRDRAYAIYATRHQASAISARKSPAFFGWPLPSAGALPKSRAIGGGGSGMCAPLLRAAEMAAVRPTRGASRPMLVPACGSEAVRGTLEAAVIIAIGLGEIAVKQNSPYRAPPSRR